ncbi:DUF7504 family protein [Halostella salina]|uniref:DUF7504 family protein n=1 Tax=Halostella salina TaxID=1547897 RepID=UPI0013CEC5FD|nr:hypothetical protein [Halostella salina]
MSETRAVLGESGAHALVCARTFGADERARCLDIVAGPDPGARTVLAVACGRSADGFVKRWLDHVDTVPTHLGVVDVGERTRAAVATPSSGESAVRGVPDPGDLDGVRTAVESLLDAWTPLSGDTVVYLDAVESLLHAASLPALTRFLEEFGAALSARPASLCAAFETGGCEDATVAAVAGAFDSVLDLDGRRRTAVTEQLDPGTLFELLSNRRQRLVLRRLVRDRDGLPLYDLAECVAEAEDADGDREHRGRVYTSLHHVDLPKLTDAGVVTVDDDVVRPTDAIAAVEPHLSMAGESTNGDAP